MPAWALGLHTNDNREAGNKLVASVLRFLKEDGRVKTVSSQAWGLTDEEIERRSRG